MQPLYVGRLRAPSSPALGSGAFCSRLPGHVRGMICPLPPRGIWLRSRSLSRRALKPPRLLFVPTGSVCGESLKGPSWAFGSGIGRRAPHVRPQSLLTSAPRDTEARSLSHNVPRLLT